MNPISNVRDAMESFHRQRNRQAVDALIWLAVFSLIQSCRMGVVVALAAVGYALIAGNWAIFTGANALFVSLLLVCLGPLVAWRKIQAA